MSITRSQRYQMAMDRAWDLQQAIDNLSGGEKARELVKPIRDWIEANYGAGHTDPTPPPEGECITCAEGEGILGECKAAKRPCGHHCNHTWTHDKCCWCGVEIGEDTEDAP